MGGMKFHLLWVVPTFMALVGISVMIWQRSFTRENGTYAPVLTVSASSAMITNPYFTLPRGTQYIYEGDTHEGPARIVVTVLPETRFVMGIEAQIVEDQEFINGELVETTRDWYVQDVEGNVWYLGEETAEYEDGELTTREGSWGAGTNGAKPGIIMKAHPEVGDSYWQEYFINEALDRADVVALDAVVAVPYGSYSGCLKTFEYTPLEPKAREFKYYCKEVGMMVREENIEDHEQVVLVAVRRNGEAAAPILTAPTALHSGSAPSSVPPAQIKSEAADAPQEAKPAPAAPQRITEAEAMVIAIRRLPGKVHLVEIERYRGREVFKVEIQPQSGGREMDVMVDRETGSVLGLED